MTSIPSLFRSTSCLFESQQPLWPAPEDSVGSKCQNVGSLVAWEVIGPALEVMEKLTVEIGALLEKHKDSLEHSEDKPRTISFNMWMVGSQPTCAVPTLVFSSKSRRKRRYAKALLKDSKLLDAYPGVKVKTLEKMPAVYNAAVHNAGELPDTFSENDVYLVKSPGGACGSLIALGASKLATIGIVIEINGAYYGTSAQHSRFDYFVEQESPAAEGQVCNFDEDSDYDEDELVEVTSRGSVSPRSGSETDTGTSTFSNSLSISDPTPSPVAVSHPPPSSTVEPEPNPRYENRVHGPRISTLAPDCVANDLDYEVFPLDDPKYHVSNSIQLPAIEGSYPQKIVLKTIARAAAETTIWAATGTTGSIRGTLMRNPYFIKMTGSRTYQEMWPVKLERGTIPGDCGACVVDDIGTLYGHIVAGDPVSGLAYIIPAYKIFDDIEQRQGARPKLATRKGAEREAANEKAKIQKAADGASVNTVVAVAAAPKPPPPSPLEEREKSIRFIDAVGREFSFPFHLCYTWPGIEDLIRQIFLYVEGIGSRVAEGYYDLFGPGGELILPQNWETMIEPNWVITMYMWPIPEPSKVKNLPVKGGREVIVIADARKGSDQKQLAIKGPLTEPIQGFRKRSLRSVKVNLWETSSPSDIEHSNSRPKSVPSPATSAEYLTEERLERHKPPPYEVATNHDPWTELCVRPLATVAEQSTLPTPATDSFDALKLYEAPNLCDPKNDVDLGAVFLTSPSLPASQSHISQWEQNRLLRQDAMSVGTSSSSQSSFSRTSQNTHATSLGSHNLSRQSSRARSSIPRDLNMPSVDLRGNRFAMNHWPKTILPTDSSQPPNPSIDGSPHLAPLAKAGVEVNLMKQSSSTETDELTLPPLMTHIRPGDQWSVDVVPGLKNPYARPPQGKVDCTQCGDHPEGFRGEHELRRHVERAHNTRKTVWVCVDVSPDKKFLSQCKACRSCKNYKSYYGAAAHLRRAHFSPRLTGQTMKLPLESIRGDKGVGDASTMETLKMWMKEVEESTSPILPSDDERKDDWMSEAPRTSTMEQQAVPYNLVERPLGVRGTTSMPPAPEFFAGPHFHEVQSRDDTFLQPLTTIDYNISNLFPSENPSDIEGSQSLRWDYDDFDQDRFATMSSHTIPWDPNALSSNSSDTVPNCFIEAAMWGADIPPLDETFSLDDPSDLKDSQSPPKHYNATTE